MVPYLSGLRLSDSDYAIMSSRNPFSTADAKTAIEQVGVFVVKDADDRSSDAADREGKKVIGKGNRFAQFYNNGYPIRTPEGLEFVYKNTMGDEVRIESSTQ